MMDAWRLRIWDEVATLFEATLFMRFYRSPAKERGCSPGRTIIISVRCHTVDES